MTTRMLTMAISLKGHSGQIGNAPNSAGKKSNSMLQLFSMHIWYHFEFLSMKKTIGKLKKNCVLFPYQICDTGVPGWRRPFEDNFILKVEVSSFLSIFEFIKLSQQHSTYVWLEFETPGVRYARKMENCGLVTFYPKHLNFGRVLFLKLMQRPNHRPKHSNLVDFS